MILRLYPTGVITDIEFTRQLRRSLDETIAAIDPARFHPDIQCDYQGSFKNASQQYEVVVDDLRSSAMLAFVGVLVLISFHFRQVFAPIFIILPLLMSLAWTFGLTKIVIGNLNQITVCLFAILFGLGIDFGIHIFARYREARRRGMGTEDALVETVVHTGSALTTTAVTTSVAFFSLLFSDFKGFSEFGFIVGTGILFSLGAMLVVCPAFIVLAERFDLIRLQQKSVPVHLLRMGRYPFSIVTVALGLAATAYSLYHLNDLRFEYDFKKLRPELPRSGPKATLPEDLKETRSPAIVLTESFEGSGGSGGGGEEDQGGAGRFLDHQIGQERLQRPAGRTGGQARPDRRHPHPAREQREAVERRRPGAPGFAAGSTWRSNNLPWKTFPRTLPRAFRARTATSCRS